jgi:hypothetical protein
MGIRGGNSGIFRKFHLGLSFNIVLLVIIGIGLLFLIINYIFLFTKFSIGDFVYNTEENLKIGQIEGINILTGNYLVKWNSGEFSNEFFWNLEKISELEGYDISSLGLKDKQNSVNFYSNFKKEDKFNDYFVSDSDEFGSTVIFTNGLAFNYTSNENCKPSYFCSDWLSCRAEYNLDNIVDNLSVVGVQYRFCKDDLKCLPNLMDSQKCIFNTEIITREKVWCNKKFLEILSLNGTVLARLDRGLNSGEVLPDNYLDVNINLITEGYCVYCFNNKKDYDETGRDCGGSCIPCGQIKK